MAWPCSDIWASLSKIKEETVAKLSSEVRELKKKKYKIRYRTRCRLCGRPRAVYRKFELCRLCFRELSLKGEIPGVTKASW
ncbi:MAG: type Z 30S ribosomal protein S14 [Candidatus Aminicenantes bacterium]|nr:type Z 30S ribosomal protein S14 [Candidatus Aminicenantes bacterium]